MGRLLVRATTHLPPTDQGRAVAPGHVFYVDPEEPPVATLLGQGYLVPVGPIPRLEPDPTDDD